MEWMNQIGGLLQQYTGADPAQASGNVDNDFDQVAQAAPQSALAGGLAEAFRSDQTPPFGNMMGQLFGQANNQQRASILNTLLSVAGPMVLQQVLNRQSGGGGGGLGGLLGGLMGGGGGQQQTITPEQAAQIPPEAVEEIAAHAEQKDPSVIDQISGIYAQHPTLIKTLGGGALAILLAKMARDHPNLTV